VTSRPSVSPPTDLRSNRPRSCAMSDTTSSAPSSCSPAARAELPLTNAVTSAPPKRASWIAKRPTPPEAPVTRTRRPRMAGPSRRMRSAVRPAVGSAAACANDTPSGSSAIHACETATRSAQAPPCRMPTTRAPARGPCSTSDFRMPAKSQPGRQPTAAFSSILSSPRLMENARTSTSTSPGADTGSGTSRKAMLPGAELSATSARIRQALRDCWSLTDRVNDQSPVIQKV